MIRHWAGDLVIGDWSRKSVEDVNHDWLRFSNVGINKFGTRDCISWWWDWTQVWIESSWKFERGVALAWKLMLLDFKLQSGFQQENKRSIGTGMVTFGLWMGQDQ